MSLDFFGVAMVEVVLAAALAGIVGVLVVLRERAFFTMALTHATFPGAVAAAMLGLSVPAGAAVAAVVLVAIATGIGRIRSQGPSVASGVMLTAGFALGALLQSLSPLPVDVESFLVGQVLAVTGADLALTASVLAVAVLVWGLGGRHLLYSSADEGGYRRAGMRPWVPEAVSLALIAATVVAIMPVVGAILGVALIVAPAAAARALVRDWRWMLLIAPLVGIASGVVGLLLSRGLGIAAGGAIALVAAAAYGLARLVGPRLPWRRRRAGGARDDAAGPAGPAGTSASSSTGDAGPSAPPDPRGTIEARTP